MLQSQIADYAASGRLAQLPPILTFQSVIDYTVSTRAIVDALYAKLPANGSELVLFDVNRAATFGPLIPAGEHALLERLLPPPPRTFRTAIVTNARANDAEVVAQVRPRARRARRRSTSGCAIPPKCSRCRISPCPFRWTTRCTA